MTRDETGPTIEEYEAAGGVVDDDIDVIPPYGIIDPDYARIYTVIRKLAWEEGYAIGLHGSFTRDLDLVAIPWAETVSEPSHLVTRITASHLKLLEVGDPTIKPHGRIAYTLHLPDFGDPRFVDLSVIPKSSNDYHKNKDDSRPYGSCPTCHKAGISRERRPNGNDCCEAGHTYPSNDAIPF